MSLYLIAAQRLIYENRKKIGLVMLVLVVAVSAFLYGKSMAVKQTEFVEVEKVRFVEVEKIVLREVEVEKKMAASVDRGKRRTIIVERRNSDGSTEKRTEEFEEKDKAASTIEIKYVDRIVEKEIEKSVDVDRTLLQKENVMNPDWRLRAALGTDIFSMPSKIQGSQFGLSDIVLTGSVERRIFGPVFAGVTASTNGVVGVGVTVEF